MPLCTLPAPHRTSSPYNHRLLETLNLNGLPFVSPMSTDCVRRFVQKLLSTYVARPAGAEAIRWAVGARWLSCRGSARGETAGKIQA